MKKICRFCGKEFVGEDAMMQRLRHLGDNNGQCMFDLSVEHWMAENLEEYE
jgi:hypothetical protein